MDQGVLEVPARSHAPAPLHHPAGVALDGAGNLFVGDFRNNRVRMVEGTGGPSVPPGLEDVVEEGIEDLTDIVLDLPTSSFEGKKAKTQENRRNALVNRLVSVSDAIADGEYASALDQLESIWNKVDGEPSPKDWVGEADATTIREQVELLIELILLLNP